MIGKETLELLQKDIILETPPVEPPTKDFVEYTEEPTGKYLVIHIVDISEEVLRPPRRFHPWRLRRSASLGSLSMSPSEESPVELPVEPPVGFYEEYSEEWSSGDSA